METILNIVTIREAAMMYHVSISTVRYHLIKGHLTYRKAIGHNNSIFIIDGQSLVALWGRPIRELSTLVSTAS